MNYREAINYLYNVRMFGTKLGLDNTFYLLDKLGNPQKKFRSIHIAGTNGKGSVAMMMNSILASAGYKTGLFTSPHISSFRERFRINTELIPEEGVVKHLEEIMPIIDEMKTRADVTHPTFFEIITAIAAKYFADEKVDFGIFEVGMGGRLDATNTIPAEICVITNIGIEHSFYLGDSVKKIAFEKGGIIKKSSTVITAIQDEEALEVIRGLCEKNSAEIMRVGCDIRWENRKSMQSTQKFDVRTKKNIYKEIVLPLLGKHQADNCSVALGVMEELQRKGVKITKENIYKGLRATKWEGRFEVVSGNPSFILDAACNPSAAIALRETLREFLGDGDRLVLMIGILRDKDFEEVSRILVPLADEIVLTEPQSSRALRVEEFRRAVGQYASAEKLKCLPDIEDALRHSAHRMEDKKGYVCVTGSIFLLGRTRKFLGLAEDQEDFKLTEILMTK